MSKIIATDKPQRQGVNRRMALKALAAIAAASQTSPLQGQTSVPMSLARPGAGPAGTLTDPDLRAGIVPWARSLNAQQLRTLEKLSALLLPADERSPSAADLGCHDFVDEWVSAPYPRQQRDRELILGGLRWLDERAKLRFGALDFVAMTTPQQCEILDSICTPATAVDAQAAQFFSLLRSLVCGAFFTTSVGMQDLQYIGNTPQSSWSLPPKEVLAHLGLEPTLP
ncbi:MAG: gluconate 2-dehydrogenase subunit 3 family protein [Pseudomonadota bacterium]|nr:gluconate 2-dehydrogenase subunit 3 family protein [Pseudomonadota bacterium]